MKGLSKWTVLKPYKQVMGEGSGTWAHSPDPTADGRQGGGDAWSRGWGKPQPFPAQSLFRPTQRNSSLVISCDVHYLKKKKTLIYYFYPQHIFFLPKEQKDHNPHAPHTGSPEPRQGWDLHREGAPASHSHPSSFPQKGSLEERHGLALDILLKYTSSNRRK